MHIVARPPSAWRVHNRERSWSCRFGVETSSVLRTDFDQPRDRMSNKWEQFHKERFWGLFSLDPRCLLASHLVARLRRQRPHRATGLRTTMTWPARDIHR